MAQLIMHWKNDGADAVAPVLPEGITVKTFPEMPDAVNVWLDIVRFMSQAESAPAGEDYYDRLMRNWPHYDENMCYFLTVDGVPAATIAVVCNYPEKKGYIHMVACKPEFRGRRLGHLLNDIALYTLKKEGMETAHLTTDDWRIPAIKTYLKAGFTPDLESEPDFRERWDKIHSAINL